MGLAVKNPIHGRIAAHRKCAFAVAASEARLVVGNTVRGKEINEMHGLVTSIALVPKCEIFLCSGPQASYKQIIFDLASVPKMYSSVSIFQQGI